MKDLTKAQGMRVCSWLLPYGVLFATAFALYFKTTGYGFLPSWDDNVYVLDNAYVRGISLQNIWGAATTVFAGNYAPLQILSYAIDFSIWGLEPKGYHLTNIILHALNACALYAVVSNISGRKDLAFIASLLFSAFPLNVENVAWISERKSLLATFFFLISIIYYIDFRKKGSLWAHNAAAISFALAVFSKTSVVILPLLLAAYEFYYMRDERKWRPLLPFVYIAAVGAIIQVWAHTTDRVIGGDIISPLFLADTVYPTMLPVFWKYVRLVLWPMDLSAYYDAAVYHSFFTPVVFLSLAALILAAVAVFSKGGAQVRFWFIWFWACLLPVSNIIPIPVYFADRYMYMPAVAFFVLVASVLTKAAAASGSGMAIKKAGYYVVVSALVFSYAVLTYNRIDVWKDDLALWSDTVRKSPRQYRVHMNLGFAYEMQRNFSAAEKEYVVAVALCPFSKDEPVNKKMLESRLERVRTKMRISKELNINYQ